VPKKQIQSIGEVLAGLTQRGELAVRLRHALIWKHWESIAGADLARFGAPLGVRDGVLFVEVAGPVWMHRYAYAKQDILDQIEVVTRAADVEDLFIRLKYDE
jgi:predicted nucleic acid-binding Zn ribbon protein